jgi:hypothetical protein
MRFFADIDFENTKKQKHRLTLFFKGIYLLEIFRTVFVFK